MGYFGPNSMKIKKLPRIWFQGVEVTALLTFNLSLDHEVGIVLFIYLCIYIDHEVGIVIWATLASISNEYIQRQI